MQKIISLNVAKSMLPVIKSKYNTKLERRIKVLTEQYKSKSNFIFKMPSEDEIKREARHEMNFSCDSVFIRELEICCQNAGDLILNANEVEYLNKLFEEKV